MVKKKAGLLVVATVIFTVMVLVNPANTIVGHSMGKGLYIIVTFPSLVKDLEPLLCSGDSITSIVPPGVDPHSYQLTVEDYRVLEKADIIVSTGHTPFEVSIRELVEEGKVKAILIEIPKIPSLEILNNPVTGNPNLHMPIYDPSNYKVFLKYVVNVMSLLNPSCRDHYVRIAEELIGKLDYIVNTTPKTNITAVADIPATQYAVSWLGVRIKYLLVREHGIPVLAEDIMRVEEALGNGTIRLVVITSPPKAHASKTLLSLAEEYNVSILYVPSPLLSESILDKIENISTQFKVITRRTPGHVSHKVMVSLSLHLIVPVVFTIVFVTLSIISYTWNRVLVAIFGILAIASLFAIFVNPIWVIVMVSAAIAYGSLSPIIASRRLYFLASVSPHAALLAATLGIPLAKLIGIGDEYTWAIIIGLGLIYLAGYMIYRGFEADIATALFVAFTASSSVLALYYVLTMFPIETSIWAIIIGDPLLAGWADAIYSLGIACLAVLAVVLTCREQICIGIDRSYVRLTGVNIRLYDLLIYTLLALTTVALIRIVGFVLEHILVLLPSTIATTLSRSAKGALVLSISVSLISSLLGLYLSILLGQAPAGITGLVLLTIYVVVLILKKEIR